MMLTAYYHQRLNLCNVFAVFLFSFLAATSTAFAAESMWQGPYVGAYLGGGFGNNHALTDAGTVTSTSYFSTAANIGAVNNSGTWTQNPNSVITGIQAGHDWVWKQLVYGLVIDYGTFSLSSSKNVTNITYPDNSAAYSINTSISTNWLFTLRGRLGFSTTIHWPSLLYVTGGMAMTQLKVSNNFSDNSAYAGTAGNNTAQNQIGWTAGAGIEFAVFRNVAVDVEYLYTHLPSVRTTSSISNTQGGFGVPSQSLTNTFATIGQFHANVLKIGLNYRFDE